MWREQIISNPPALHTISLLNYLCDIVVVRYLSSGFCGNWTSWANPADLDWVLENLLEECIQCYRPVTLQLEDHLCKQHVNTKSIEGLHDIVGNKMPNTLAPSTITRKARFQQWSIAACLTARHHQVTSFKVAFSSACTKFLARSLELQIWTAYTIDY